MSEKEKQSIKTVKNYMWWSMGAGLIPIPVLDLAAIAGVQLKMVSEVSKLYDVPFEENRGKALISTLVGFILERSVAFGSVGSLLKAIPGVGPWPEHPRWRCHAEPTPGRWERYSSSISRRA